MANTNRRVIVTGVVLNGLDIRPTLVDSDLLREPLGLNRFVYEGLGGVPITMGVRRTSMVAYRLFFATGGSARMTNRSA